MRKYTLPSFLSSFSITEEDYRKWLFARAQQHVIRDRKRSIKNVSVENYRQKIHNAVIESKGKDAYTGDDLDWSLINMWGKEGFDHDKKRFWNAPTVDHEFSKTGYLEFKICSWKFNDFKGDMNLDELKEFCKKFLEKIV